jgi:hypothetical protein
MHREKIFLYDLRLKFTDVKPNASAVCDIVIITIALILTTVK